VRGVAGGELARRTDACAQGAKIYAQASELCPSGAGLSAADARPRQNAIRKKSEALNYLKLGSRLDAVVSRLETQAKMNVVNKSFATIVRSLERSLATNNLEQVSQTMDAFERAFENLDVQAECVEGAMGRNTAMATPPDQVAALLTQVAEEHNLELSLELPAASREQTGLAAAPAVPQDDLSRRLAELKAR